MSDTPSAHQIAVIGGGPTGLCAALALAEAGHACALIAPRAPYADNRTTALFGSSIALLDRLGVWETCRGQSAPLRRMRLVDDTQRLFRSSEVTFSSDEIGLDAFGYNIANHILVDVLEACLSDHPKVQRIASNATSVSFESDVARMALGDGSALAAQLVIGADGKHSMCREMAGIALKTSPYPQAALTFNMRLQKPHQDISTEFHTRQGPCVIVPLPGDRASVVCVAEPAQAQHLSTLSDDALAREMEKRTHSIYGHLTIEPGRGLFPLAIMAPERLVAPRLALVGEAAHVVPPIGAQGLNLGFRDVATICDVVGGALAQNRDPGALDVLAAYEHQRLPDIASRMRIIDMANRTLLSDLIPAQAARMVGMEALGRIGPLRHLVMREGINPSSALSRIIGTFH